MPKFDIKSEVFEEISVSINEVSDMNDIKLFDACMDLQMQFPSLDVLERIKQAKENWKSKMRNLLLTKRIVEIMMKAGYDKDVILPFLEDIVARTSGQTLNHNTDSLSS